RPPQPARPGAPPAAREHGIPGLAALTGDYADRAWEQRARERLLRLEQAVRGEPPAQTLELHEQVALAGDAQLRDGEAERGRGRRASWVVVAASADDDPKAVGQGYPERVEIALPHRARQRPAGVAQLEVHPSPAGAKPPHLAGQLHPRELLQPPLELRGIRPDRVRARELG